MKGPAALLVAMTLVAAAAQAGSVSGLVRDEQGALIQGAQITLANGENSSNPLTTASDAQGAYHFLSVPAGTYHLQASFSGFATAQSGSISVSTASSEVKMDLTLARARPQFQAAGVRGLIDPGGYSASTNAAAASGLIKGIADIKRTGDDPSAETRTSAPCSFEPALKKAVEEKPESVEANLKLGDFYLAHDEAAQAILILEHARSLDPGDQSAIKQLAEAYLEAGRFDSAEKLLTPLAGTSDGAKRLRLLARAHEGSGSFAQAARDYEAAAERDPSEENLFGAGYELILAGLPKDAEEAFETGVKRYPQSSKLLIGLGSAQFLEGHSSDSIPTLLRAAELNPTDARPYPFLAEASVISRVDGERVREAFERYFSAAPNDARASYYCALNLLQEHAADGAHDGRIEALLKHAILLDAGLADAHFQLGVFYANRQEYEHGSQELETAVRLSPNLPEARYRLALAYRQTGRKDLSSQEMHRFEEMQKASAAQSAGGKVSIDQFISVFAAPEAGARRENLCPGDSP